MVDPVSVRIFLPIPEARLRLEFVTVLCLSFSCFDTDVLLGSNAPTEWSNIFTGCMIQPDYPNLVLSNSTANITGLNSPDPDIYNLS